jgi:dihydroflavonol-4-reductase
MKALRTLGPMNNSRSAPIENMTRIAFVTGAAGFLGRHVVTELLLQGWDVTAMVRGKTPDWLARTQVKVVQGHLDNLDDVQKGMPDAADAVLHLAANISMWRGEREAIDRDNIKAARNVFTVAQAKGARRIVMTSTLGVFNTRLGPVNEDGPLREADDTNPYLRSKLAADRLLDDAAQHGLTVVSLHPSHLLGAHDRSGWVSLFDQACANQLRAAPRGCASFCSARAVAQAHIAAATHPNPRRRYVLGGAQASYLELFAAIAKRVGARPVTKTMPNLALHLTATVSGWISAVTGKKPTMTPGLAEVLTGQMLADTQVAIEELGYWTRPLDALLDETHQDWAKQAGARGSQSRSTASVAR